MEKKDHKPSHSIRNLGWLEADNDEDTMRRILDKSYWIGNVEFCLSVQDPLQDIYSRSDTFMRSTGDFC